MLAETVVKILPDTPLLASAHFKNGLLQAAPLGDIDSRGDQILGRAIAPRKNRAGPGDATLAAVTRDPMRFVIARDAPGAQLREDRLRIFKLVRNRKQVPELLAFDFFEGISGGDFAGAIESHDAPVGI